MRAAKPALTRRNFLRALGVLGAGLLAGCVPAAQKVTSVPTQGAAASEPSVTPVSQQAEAVATAAPTETSVPVVATVVPTEAATVAPTEAAQSIPTLAPTRAPARAGKPIVAIARCDAYGPAKVEKVVREIVGLAGGLEGIVKPGGTVVIKPNITAGGRVPSNDGLPVNLTYVTHPDVVRAIALLAKEAGAQRIILVEGWGLDIWDATGYGPLIKELGAEPLNHDDPAPEPDFVSLQVPNPYALNEVLLHKVIAEAETFISVPKMKCHASAGITLSIKNIFGCTPLPRYRNGADEQSRTKMHEGNWGERLPRILVDILKVRPIDFAVVDAISTIDQSEGPWNNGANGIKVKTIRPGLLLAGANPVAVDAVGTAVMGFDATVADGRKPFPSGVNHIALAASADLGPVRLEEIQVKGLTVAEAKFPFTSCPKMSEDVAHRMHLAMRAAAQKRA